MPIDRIKLAVPGALILLAGCSPDAGNIITGEGLPNPNPVVTNEWGELPAGRNWGHTAGIDIDPTDGHIWAYERCGAGGGVSDSNPDFAVWTSKDRINEAISTGAEAIVTACPWCEKTLNEAVTKSGSSLKVFDIVELVEKAI